MELKDNCTILLERATQKVKCFKFKSKELDRDLALHENTENKMISDVSDVVTGLRMFSIPVRIKDVKEQHISEWLDKFIKHYTPEVILAKCKEEEKVPMTDKFKRKK